MTDQNNTYCIIVRSGVRNTYHQPSEFAQYYTVVEAESEARRLAAANPGQTFVVCRVISRLEVSSPVQTTTLSLEERH